MSTDQKNSLFHLIKALNKSEKRQFKLYVGRNEKSSDANYLTLFDLIDKMEDYDEDVLLKKSSFTRKQLSNLKANLYRQILVSLRLTPSHQTEHIQIREQLDFATILYNKGLYAQSLKVLERAKITALDIDETNMAYEIVEFEKVIEAQYITRSHSSRADELAISAKEISIRNVLSSKLSNLSLQLHSFLLKNGYAKNEDDYLKSRNYFYYHLPTFDIAEIGFKDKLYLYQSQLWYSFIIQDFKSGYKNAQKWVDLFEEYPERRYSDPAFYIKGYHYLLESLYYLRYNSKMKIILAELDEITDDPKIVRNENLMMLSFIYGSFGQLNFHFLNGDFAGGLEIIPGIEKKLKDFTYKIDAHHKMVFYYKFACMHFGADNWEHAVAYLQKIIDNKDLGMREDLLCYSRILRLICFYELGWENHVDSAIRSTYKFLLKMNDLHEVQVEIIRFLRNLNHIYPSELKGAFYDLFRELKKLEDHPFEKRSFLYLDILSWLESKIEAKPIGEIIMDKAKVLK